MIRLISILIVLLPAFAHGDELSLDQYVTEVLSANPSVQASGLRAKALIYRVAPAGALDDLFVAAGLDEIPLDGSRGSARRYQISQSLPFPGKRSSRERAAENRAQAAENDSETFKRSIKVAATQVYYRAYYNQQSFILNERLEKLLEGNVASTKARYRTGDTGHHDWLLAKAELSILAVERLKLERERATLRALLNELRNRSPEEAVGTLVLQVKQTPKEASDLSLQPELQAIKFSLNAASEEARQARLSYFPDFVLQGMMMEPQMKMNDMGEPTEKSNWGVMVGISVPVYFWKKQSELVKAARLNEEAARAEQKSLENRLKTETVDASQQLKSAADIVRLYEDSVLPTTKLAVSQSQSSYAAKRGSLSQLIDALRAQRTQELELVAAKIDLELAKVRLSDVLSSPPIMRFAPSRPTLFGGGGGMGSMGTSETVNMGTGMSGPTRKSKDTSTGTTESGSTKMEGM